MDSTDGQGLPSPQHDQVTHGAAPMHGAPALPSRRRWLSAGLKASPAVLSLAASPVLAWQCKTPSAHASANLSNRTYKTWPDNCTATSASWSSKFSGSATAKDACGTLLAYPTGCSSTTTCASLMGSGGTTTVKSLLATGTGWQKTLLTAMLNIKCTRVPSTCVTEATIAAMWAAGPAYQPSPGITWSKQQQVDYLHNNWIATVTAFGGTPPTA